MYKVELITQQHQIHFIGTNNYPQLVADLYQRVLKKKKKGLFKIYRLEFAGFWAEYFAVANAVCSKSELRWILSFGIFCLCCWVVVSMNIEQVFSGISHLWTV